MDIQALIMCFFHKYATLGLSIMKAREIAPSFASLVEFQLSSTFTRLRTATLAQLVSVEQFGAQVNPKLK